MGREGGSEKSTDVNVARKKVTGKNGERNTEKQRREDTKRQNGKTPLREKG